MGYCKTIYEIFKTEKGTWDKMTDQVLEQCEGLKNVVRLIFFAAPEDNREYLLWKSELVHKVNQRFTELRPLVTLIAQRPLDAGLTLEVHYLGADFSGRLSEIPLEEEGYYLKVEEKEYREVLLGGLCGKNPDLPVKEQATQAFEKAGAVLKREGMNWGNVVRQWNYLERITEFSNGNQRYQDFNDVRSQFYASSVWSMGYPAATGIGAQFGGVVVDLNAVKADSDEIQIVPLDNDLQVAAHVYSSEVLVSQESHKTTPKFERAKVVSDGKRGLVYVSGTAAIRGENSLKNVGVLVQTGITMENIEHLIRMENLQKAGNLPAVPNEMKMLRVYLKEAEDIEPVKIYMDRVFTRIPVAYLLADVCRDELLIEIEGVAVF